MIICDKSILKIQNTSSISTTISNNNTNRKKFNNNFISIDFKTNKLLNLTMKTSLILRTQISSQTTKFKKQFSTYSEIQNDIHSSDHTTYITIERARNDIEIIKILNDKKHSTFRTSLLSFFTTTSKILLTKEIQKLNIINKYTSKELTILKENVIKNLTSKIYISNFIQPKNISDVLFILIEITSSRN